MNFSIFPTFTKLTRLFSWVEISTRFYPNLGRTSSKYTHRRHSFYGVSCKERMSDRYMDGYQPKSCLGIKTCVRSSHERKSSSSSKPEYRRDYCLSEQGFYKKSLSKYISTIVYKLLLVLAQLRRKFSI